MNGINLENGLEPVKKSGAFWVRRNALLWSEVEPQEGKRNWGALAGLENEMKNASRDGLSLILIVRSTPYWAQKFPGVACSAVKPDKLAAFGSFMRDLVARYSPPPYSVKYWEIGNEPDIAPELVSPDSIFGCWGDSKVSYYGGEYYAEMLKVVYPQVKAADPQAQVSIGGLLFDCNPDNPPEPSSSGKLYDCTAGSFLEGILKMAVVIFSTLLATTLMIITLARLAHLAAPTGIAPGTLPVRSRSLKLAIFAVC